MFRWWLGKLMYSLKGSRTSRQEVNYQEVSVWQSGRGIIRQRVVVNGKVIVDKNVDHAHGSASNLEHEIDKGYDSVDKLTVQGADDIVLGFSDDAKVYINGTATTEPVLQNRDLLVDGLEGKLSVPKSEPVELDINSAGDISGDVGHNGRIATSAGDITLKLYAPLTVEASASAGNISVKGMVFEGRGVYTPSNMKPAGTVRLNTAAGDIKVNYMLR